MVIKRTIEPLLTSKLNRGRVLVLYGPRRVGKTTLTRKLLNNASSDEQLYLNCDELATQEALKPTSLAAIERAIGGAKFIVIDEAQRVENIGLTLKLLIDAHPHLNILATGSSSFELSNKVKEPLTGRSYEFFLSPLSMEEISGHFGYSALQAQTLIDRLLRLGSYPGILLDDEEQAKEELLAIAERYVYKDSLELVELRQRQLLPKLLQALALSIGQEVSYHDLGSQFGVKLETIERYITLLESAFIVYRVPALSGSKPGDVSNRKRKVYFYDLGIRNALIQSLQPLNLRNDLNVLWENFCMNERLKWWNNKNKDVKRYYWRGLTGSVDLVENNDSGWRAFSFDLEGAPQKLSKYFTAAYPGAEHQTIGRHNFNDWLK